MRLVSIDRRLRALEAEQRARERAAERKAADMRQLGDGITPGGVNNRQWSEMGPDGHWHTRSWEPWMGPWETLAALIDATEDATQSRPCGRPLADLNAEFQARTTRPATTRKGN